MIDEFSIKYAHEMLGDTIKGAASSGEAYFCSGVVVTVKYGVPYYKIDGVDIAATQAIDHILRVLK